MDSVDSDDPGMRILQPTLNFRISSQFDNVFPPETSESEDPNDDVEWLASVLQDGRMPRRVGWAVQSVFVDTFFGVVVDVNAAHTQRAGAAVIHGCQNDYCTSMILLRANVT